MRRVVELSRLRGVARVACFGLVAAGIAGCSSESSRLGDSAFSNPFASKNTRGSAEVTGSVQAAPVGRVETRPLQYNSTQSLPPPYASQPATVASSGQAGGGRGMGSYTPAASAPVPTAPAAIPASRSDVTGTVRPLPPPPASRPDAQTAWNWDGGSAVIVGRGETVDSLSRKYGVPGHAILQANGFTSASAIQPGQRIVIPRYNYNTAAATPAVAAPRHAAAPMVPPAVAGGTVHVVAPGETLISISRHYHRPLVDVAAANRIAPHTRVKMGDRLVIPGAVAAAAPVAAPPKAAAPAVAALPRPQMRAQAPAPGPQLAAVPSARVATPVAEAVADDDAPVVGSTGGAPSFRWPVRGRVIAGFGAKPNGQQNDGINLAVPEGTAVRASDDGVVAYAGNELKGYGNLILVRHANGFVTAYAHASEIMVKRNDPVRRGQVIGKSGQSGTVTTPQLHFEIRKGSAPVDPMQYLPAG
jgi:murein DD-endopeptidase MepM/ murein hydrolase activator NlpD